MGGGAPGWRARSDAGRVGSGEQASWTESNNSNSRTGEYVGRGEASAQSSTRISLSPLALPLDPAMPPLDPLAPSQQPFRVHLTGFGVRSSPPRAVTRPRVAHSCSRSRSGLTQSTPRGRLSDPSTAQSCLPRRPSQAHSQSQRRTRDPALQRARSTSPRPSSLSSTRLPWGSFRPCTPLTPPLHPTSSSTAA